MSSNKYTSRGFGASGASQSSWNAPRESYKPAQDTGSSFLFGGSGLRGSPKSAGHHQLKSPDFGSQLSAKASPVRDEGPSRAAAKDGSDRPRGLDLSGGDITTTKLERSLLFVGLLVAALVFSMFVRACAGGTDSDWVRDHRSMINQDEEAE